MFSLELTCTPEEKDLLIAELWDSGSVGITELGETRLRAFFENDSHSQALLEKFGGEWRREEPQDWVEVARARLEPMLVGSQFFLVPEWRDDPTPPHRFRIEVNPGMAFGTGFHESTQLCLEALERELKPGMTVLDVGTGSGILSIAARLLGAKQVWSCDVDPEAVVVARAHVPTFVGSADAAASGCADLVIANINPEVIIGLASELLRCLRPGGIALVSGFENDEVADVERTFEGRVKEVHRKGNWSLAVIRTPGPRAQR